MKKTVILASHNGQELSITNEDMEHLDLVTLVIEDKLTGGFTKFFMYKDDWSTIKEKIDRFTDTPLSKAGVQ